MLIIKNIDFKNVVLQLQNEIEKRLANFEAQKEEGKEENKNNLNIQEFIKMMRYVA